MKKLVLASLLCFSLNASPGYVLEETKGERTVRAWIDQVSDLLAIVAWEVYDGGEFSRSGRVLIPLFSDYSSLLSEQVDCETAYKIDIGDVKNYYNYDKKDQDIPQG